MWSFLGQNRSSAPRLEKKALPASTVSSLRCTSCLMFPGFSKSCRMTALCNHHLTNSQPHLFFVSRALNGFTPTNLPRSSGPSAAAASAAEVMQSREVKVQMVVTGFLQTLEEDKHTNHRGTHLWIQTLNIIYVLPDLFIFENDFIASCAVALISVVSVIFNLLLFEFFFYSPCRECKTPGQGCTDVNIMFTDWFVSFCVTQLYKVSFTLPYDTLDHSKLPKTVRLF